MNRYQQKGFAQWILPLGVILVAVVAFAAWRVAQQQPAASNSNKGNSTAVSGFESCKKAAGSKLLESFPEICVTKEGRSYTNSGQASGICQEGQAGPCNSATAQHVSLSGTVTAIDLSAMERDGPGYYTVKLSDNSTVIIQLASGESTCDPQAITVPKDVSVGSQIIASTVHEGDKYNVCQTGTYIKLKT